MPSFDVVSKVNLAELDNALQQVKKEVDTRYDFKGAKAEIEQLPENTFFLKAADQERLDAMRDVLYQKLAKRGISLRNVEVLDAEPSGLNAWKQKLIVKQGVAADKAKLLVAAIKESKIKVQGSIQGDSLRVTGKNRDDLQDCMKLLRSKGEEIQVTIQFENFRD